MVRNGLKIIAKRVYTRKAQEYIGLAARASGHYTEKGNDMKTTNLKDPIRGDKLDADGLLPPGPKYPQVKVQLTGEDGNAFFIMGRVTKAMRRAGLTPEQIKGYQNEAMSGDYDHLLQVTMQYVEVS